MEFYDGGDLQQALELHEYAMRKYGKPVLDILMGLRICLHALSGLRYLHTQKVLHNDIKPSNIVLRVSSRGTIQAALVDFGLSKQLTTEIAKFSRKNMDGSLPYKAPEDYSDHGKLSTKSDIYSFALVVWQVVSGSSTVLPVEPSQYKFMMKVAEEGLRPPIGILKDFPAVQKFITTNWATNPKERLNADEAFGMLLAVHEMLRSGPKDKTPPPPPPLPTTRELAEMEPSENSNQTLQALILAKKNEGLKAAPKLERQRGRNNLAHLLDMIDRRRGSISGGPAPGDDDRWEDDDFDPTEWNAC